MLVVCALLYWHLISSSARSQPCYNSGVPRRQTLDFNFKRGPVSAGVRNTGAEHSWEGRRIRLRPDRRGIEAPGTSASAPVRIAYGRSVGSETGTSGRA